MTIHEARLIRQLKVHRLISWRALSAMYYPKDHPDHGDQLSGRDLCLQAAELLGIDEDELDNSHEDWRDNE